MREDGTAAEQAFDADELEKSQLEARMMAKK